MPFPPEYQRATDHFYDFLMDARDSTGLTSAHMAYTTVQGVFQAFRRRLGLRDAVRFAQILPAGLRALFVADWDPDEPVLPFGDRDAMTKEVQSLRANHNFAPETAIRDVARALRKHVDERALDSILATLPNGAADFWRS
jgi:uncharacterized protein (DUF2267 family)